MNTTFYGEHGIDKIIREKYFPDYGYKGTLVEVGGGTPEFLSMSKHFKDNNWRTVIVEPNPTFCNLHKQAGNELYEFACSYTNQDDVDFTVVHVNSGEVTDHSFSALSIKESYRKISNNWVDALPKTTIKVNVRTLDSIIQMADIKNIDILTVDTEGWEIEVMRGLSVIQPKIVVLENVCGDPSYSKYMNEKGYKHERNVSGNDIYKYDKF